MDLISLLDIITCVIFVGSDPYGEFVWLMSQISSKLMWSSQLSHNNWLNKGENERIGVPTFDQAS